MNFNYIDILILVPLLLGIYKGISLGFINSIIRLISALIAAYIAISFMGILYSYLQESFLWDETMSKIIAFTTLFIMSVFIINLAGSLLTKFLNFILLGWINKCLGGIFGFLKNLLIMGLLVVLINSIDSRVSILPEDLKKSSLFYYPLLNLTQKAIPKLKELEVYDYFEKKSL